MAFVFKGASNGEPFLGQGAKNALRSFMRRRAEYSFYGYEWQASRLTATTNNRQLTTNNKNRGTNRGTKNKNKKKREISKEVERRTDLTEHKTNSSSSAVLGFELFVVSR